MISMFIMLACITTCDRTMTFRPGQTVYFNTKEVHMKGLFDKNLMVKRQALGQFSRGTLRDVTYRGADLARVEILYTPKFSSAGFVTLKADVIRTVPEQNIILLKR